MSAQHRFIGGMRFKGRNASWPLAALTISDDGDVTVQLRGQLQRALYGGWLPTTVYRLVDAAEAENVRGGLLGSQGVRLRAEGQQTLVYWTTKPWEVLTALGERGMKVLWHEHPPKVWIKG